MNVENLLRGAFGIFFLYFICFLLSNDRKSINWKLVGLGFGLQIALAVSIIYLPGISLFFDFIARAFVKVINIGKSGSRFLFGSLVDDSQSWGYIFAVQALPNIIFFAALSTVLYYFGILQKVVLLFAWLLHKIGVSGPESISASANVFLGQTEAPLLVKPYLEKMRKSEILCIMIGGMATTAGSVLGVYVTMLGGNDPVEQQKYAKLLLTASVMAAPAGVVVSKILFPDNENQREFKELHISKEKIGDNLLEAISNGTIDGLKLAVNVGAMLIAFIALIAVVNTILGFIGNFTHTNESISSLTNGRFSSLSLEFIMGYLFAPIGWIMGVQSADITLFGQLLGEKTIVNEFIAYQSLSKMKFSGLITNEKTLVMSSFSLCGFANFSSIGIQIGGCLPYDSYLGRRTFLA
jgi:CNT family concentrative nucleoside transporter